jgi:hypothetical protein
MLITVFIAVASVALGAPFEEALDTRDGAEYTTEVMIHGNAPLSIGDISAFELVREALDELCTGQDCDTTRWSTPKTTTKGHTNSASELKSYNVSISANAIFPVLKGADGKLDGGELARTSLKTAMVEAVRLGEQRKWLEYSVYPDISSGIAGMNMLHSKWDWFGSIHPQYALYRSQTGDGSQAGHIRIDFHVEVLGPKADFCSVLSNIVGSLASGIGLLPMAGPILGFLGSIAARGAGSCAKSKRDGEYGAYVPNFTNNSYTQSLLDGEKWWSETSAALAG